MPLDSVPVCHLQADIIANLPMGSQTETWRAILRRIPIGALFSRFRLTRNVVFLGLRRRGAL